MNKATRNQRSFKNYVIKRRFQWKWTSLLLLVTCGIFGVLAAYIYTTEQQASEQIILGLNQMGYEAAEADLMAEMFRDEDTSILSLLIGIASGLITALVAIGITLTHRVAGPVYALELFIQQVRNGSYRPIRGFRKGDEFQELAESFQAMVSSLHEKEEDEIKQLQSLLNSPGISAELVTQLEGMIAEKQRSLA